MNLHEQMRARAVKLPANSKWYEIQNADTATAVVRIYGEIGYWGVTADQFASDLGSLSAETIEVQINSPGGEVFDGIAIYNTLRTHPSRVVTRVDGIAASVASVIAQAGDHRIMVESSQMMIHEAWGVAVGPAADMRAFADLLDAQSDVIAGIYASRSGGKAEDFRELLAAETWLTDQAAVDLGLADEVLVPSSAQARISVAVASASEPVADNAAELDRDLWSLEHRAV